MSQDSSQFPELQDRLSGESIRIDKNAVKLGRGDTCDIPLPHGDVSREHVSLEYIDGRWMVRDLGSSNLTFLNDVRIKSGESHPVKDGDILGLASSEFKISIPDTGPAVAEAVAKAPAPRRSNQKPTPREVVARTDYVVALAYLEYRDSLSRRAAITKEVCILGSDPSQCDIVIPDDAIHPTHARLTLRKDGLYVETLQSGSVVISAGGNKRSALIPHLAKFRLGELSLVFHALSNH